MLLQKDLPIIHTKLKEGKILIAGDFHIPFQDNKAVNAFISYAADTQPEVIIINGDLLDFYRLSKFVKGDERNPMQEIAEGKIILETIRVACPNSNIYYPIGNHESRLETYIFNKAPDLEPLIDNFYKLLDCENYNIQGCHKVIFNKNFVCKHGELVAQKSGQTAIKELEKEYMNGVSGHTHRLSRFITRKNGVKFQWAEAGCLCTMKPHYILQPDWQQGFIDVTIKDYKIYKMSTKEIEDGRIL